MDLRSNPVKSKGSEFLCRPVITESSDEIAGLNADDPEVKKCHCFVTEPKPNAHPSLLESIN